MLHTSPIAQVQPTPIIHSMSRKPSRQSSSSCGFSQKNARHFVSHFLWREIIVLRKCWTIEDTPFIQVHSNWDLFINIAVKKKMRWWNVGLGSPPLLHRFWSTTIIIGKSLARSPLQLTFRFSPVWIFGSRDKSWASTFFCALLPFLSSSVQKYVGCNCFGIVICSHDSIQVSWHTFNDCYQGAAVKWQWMFKSA